MANKVVRFSDFYISKPEEILILDNPGAYGSVAGFTIYDGQGNRIFQISDSTSKLSVGQQKKLQDILNRARLLAGLSINTDLKLLNKEGLYLYQDVACIDLSTTFNYLVSQGYVENKNLKDNGPKGMVQCFGIDGTSKETGWVKYKIFEALSQFREGLLNQITPKVTIKIRPQAGEKWIELTKEGVARMETPAEAPAAVESVVEYQGFYEVLLSEEGDYIIVRMTASEYRLFTEIQKCRSDFTVKMFYETILKPGIVQRLLGKL